MPSTPLYYYLSQRFTSKAQMVCRGVKEYLREPALPARVATFKNFEANRY